MNLRISDGCVFIDGRKVCDGSISIFTKGGLDLPEKMRPCDKCRQWHDPDLCCHQPKDRQPAPADPWVDPPGRVATIRDVNRRVWSLLEDLEKRFDARAEKIWNLGVKNESARIFSELGAELHAEKECWK